MGGLFKSPAPPPPPPPPDMPAPDSPEVLAAKRRKQDQIRNRAGRASTILSGGATGSDSYGGSNLGSQ